MKTALPWRVELVAEGHEGILSPEALAFVARLRREQVALGDKFVDFCALAAYDRLA